MFAYPERVRVPFPENVRLPAREDRLSMALLTFWKHLPFPIPLPFSFSHGFSPSRCSSLRNQPPHGHQPVFVVMSFPDLTYRSRSHFSLPRGSFFSGFLFQSLWLISPNSVLRATPLLLLGFFPGFLAWLFLRIALTIHVCALSSPSTFSLLIDPHELLQS